MKKKFGRSFQLKRKILAGEIFLLPPRIPNGPPLIFSFHLSLAPCIKTNTKTQEMALRRLYFSKFSWRACPRTPLEVLTPSAQVGQIRVCPYAHGYLTLAKLQGGPVCPTYFFNFPVPSNLTCQWKSSIF